MEITSIAVILSLVAMVTAQSSSSSSRSGDSRSISYEYFDDYLLTVGAPNAHNEVLKQEGSFEMTTSVPMGEEGPVTYADILGYFRDVPRQHWSCCMLGMLAGNKGFHCNAAFYAARVATRNTNRAHNRDLPFHGRDRIPHWGRQIMHTFSRCVLHHSEDFHKCCYAATVERRERVRWQQFRDFTEI